MVLILLVVVEEETTIHHDWVVLLSDLVSLRQISVHIVFPVELDLGKDAATKSERCLDSLVEAFFVQDGEHAWQTQIDEVCVSVWLLTRCVQRGYKFAQNE